MKEHLLTRKFMVESRRRFEALKKCCHGSIGLPHKNYRGVKNADKGNVKTIKTHLRSLFLKFVGTTQTVLPKLKISLHLDFQTFQGS